MTIPDKPEMNTAERRRAVAQLLVVRASGHASDRQRRYPRWELNNAALQELLEAGVGGVILLGGSATDLQQRCRSLRHWAGHSDLLLCADVEEGVGQRFEGASWLVPPMALGRLQTKEPDKAVALAERYGRITGEQAKRCGLNWVLGPVCDVNSNPANPVINVRAWGQNAHGVADLAEAFQRGLRSSGVLGCAKHFPGHGDTAQDSHLELPVICHSRERLKQLELIPFQRLIAAEVASVMTAHLLVPSLDDQQPATLSKPVLTDLLRQDLGFQGLVVTDALVMEAISRHLGPGEAAVQAFEAGSDLILMPADAHAAIDAICAALDSGRIPESRLHESMQRRQEALKSCSKLEPGTPGHAIETEADHALAMELVERSLETQGPSLSPTAQQAGMNLIRVDGVLPCPVLRADSAAVTAPESLGYETRICHDKGLSPWADHGDPNEPLDLVALGDGVVFLQLFLRGNPFRGAQERSEPWAEAIEQLLRHERLAGLIVYGCPYRWDALRSLLPASTPAGYSPGQMPEAQECLLTKMMGTTPAQTGIRDFTD
ncbi:MAG: glycoside hydrolase family 3 N-terminal domain-containing protein [Cyanobacteriota bacterium]|nr:glycoside hydrolase family 3 N-terminal domain-containing protein [Cyanobacteriota bacterium]